MPGRTPDSNNMKTNVCVIIPFFQREAGILRRALRSISSQVGDLSITVLIVDDSSPVPAEPETGEVANGVTVRVIRQPNSGPGAARNRGLDHVPPGTDFVAFLDSDDQWTPEHLLNAITTLGAELDFYFTNYREPEGWIDDGRPTDAFSAYGRLNPAEHRSLERGASSFAYRGDLVEHVFVGNIIHTSTVVYRWAPLGAIRFRQDYRNACEDHIFWIDAAAKSRGTAFSSNIECHCGRGISLWRSAGLGSDRIIFRLTDERRYLSEIGRRFPTFRERHPVLLRARESELRHRVVADVLHRARRRMAVNWKAIWSYLRSDPLLAACALPIALSIVARRQRTD